MADELSEWIGKQGGKSAPEATRASLLAVVGSQYSYMSLPELWQRYFSAIKNYTGSLSDQFAKYFAEINPPQSLKNPFYAAASSIYSPRALFGPGEQGGWYDPSDISTLFQDTAGTIPVTAAGQPVARVNDKSPNANHLLQPTAAARPLYQEDGVNGYLSFDGVDDHMIVTYASAPTDATAVLGALQLAPAANVDIWNNRSTGGWVMRLAVGATLDVFGVSGGAPIAPLASVAFDPLSRKFVFSAGLSTTQVFSALDTGGANTQSAATVAGDTRFTLGALNTTLANNLLSGRVYQLTHIHRALTAPELLALQNFTKAKSGVA